MSRRKTAQPQRPPQRQSAAQQKGIWRGQRRGDSRRRKNRQIAAQEKLLDISNLSKVEKSPKRVILPKIEMVFWLEVLRLTKNPFPIDKELPKVKELKTLFVSPKKNFAKNQ